mmetsp:Transcript_26893/g.59510  ORF Transcript_26893/g.59510 Transcript_26893/m.59510 type:complete len:256 (+) Transcript_26893:47-814(+)
MASLSRRNPHSAVGAPPPKVMDRVERQWYSAAGCPISDEAKLGLGVDMPDGFKFVIADVRVWRGCTNRKEGDIALEFFFDGTLHELAEHGGESTFVDKFAEVLERTLQERRIRTFREKVELRRGKPKKVDDEEASLIGAPSEQDVMTDTEWKSYLTQKIPDTGLGVHSFREAGCVLMFVVANVTVSDAAAETLGQLCFPEYFPIDGREQKVVYPDLPWPRWMKGMLATTIFLLVLVLFAWFFTFRAALSQYHGES